MHNLTLSSIKHLLGTCPSHNFKATHCIYPAKGKKTVPSITPKVLDFRVILSIHTKASECKPSLVTRMMQGFYSQGWLKSNVKYLLETLYILFPWYPGSSEITRDKRLITFYKYSQVCRYGTQKPSLPVRYEEICLSHWKYSKWTLPERWKS